MSDIVVNTNAQIDTLVKRVSAFAGSDLEIMLRSHKAESLVLPGFSTSGVVLSTLLEASDRDYHMTLLNDACADPYFVFLLIKNGLFRPSVKLFRKAERLFSERNH